ncbi:MAG: long-chain-fatty-acid--CoA ligase [Nitrospirales bacterium]
MLRAWHCRYDPGVPYKGVYPAWTLLDLLERSVARYGNNPALFFYGTWLSYRALDDLTTRFALSLQALGVEPGDRVAIMLPNCPQAFIAYYGALRAGAVVVLINPLFVAREIQTVVEDSGSGTILALDLFYPRVRDIARAGRVKRIILTSLREFLPPLRRLLYPLKLRLSGRAVHVNRREPVLALQALLRKPPTDRPAILPVVKPDDLALLQYTGGTTGTPKGAMLTHRNLVTNTQQCRLWVPDFQEGREVFLGVVPFFHAYGLSTCQHLAVMTGSTMILLPRFDVREALRAISRHRVSIFSGIPAMFMAMNDYPQVGRYNLRSLRVCLSGASPLHAEVRNRFERLTGVKISEGYGLTEASPVTHCNPVYGERPDGAIGVPFPDTDCRVVDQETGRRELPPGEVGELVVRGPQIMQGYWNKPEETAAVLRDGWLYTGDLVRQDRTGFFYLVDRKKDMIKSRGENVYPREVEEVLFTHPLVKDAVVVGIPDVHLGEAVKAFVVPVDGQTLTEADLIAHCQQWLGRFKVPTRIEFRTALPRNLVGKVLRRVLREEEMARVLAEGLSRRA